MKRRTPQEKKALSYERDRRNTYGEAPHAARKSIPLRKALRNRANRHQQNQQLRYGGPAPDETLADEFESRMYRRAPRVWKKDADSPLGEVVARKVEGRALLHERGGRAAVTSVFIWNRETGELVPVPPQTPTHK
jgi:hypothetical protein